MWRGTNNSDSSLYMEFDDFDHIRVLGSIIINVDIHINVMRIRVSHLKPFDFMSKYFMSIFS